LLVFFPICVLCGVACMMLGELICIAYSGHLELLALGYTSI
jgi:hypothetical protein